MDRYDLSSLFQAEMAPFALPRRGLSRLSLNTGI